MVLLISYDLNNHERPSSYQAVRAVIERYAASVRKPLYSQWFVETADDPQMWYPSLEPVLTRLSLKVHWWQLGRDQDTSFVGFPDLPRKMSALKHQLHIRIGGLAAREAVTQLRHGLPKISGKLVDFVLFSRIVHAALIDRPLHGVLKPGGALVKAHENLPDLAIVTILPPRILRLNDRGQADQRQDNGHSCRLF